MAVLGVPHLRLDIFPWNHTFLRLFFHSRPYGLFSKHRLCFISHALHSPKLINLWWSHSTRRLSVTSALPSWWGSYVKVAPVKVKTTVIFLTFNDFYLYFLLLNFNKYPQNVKLKLQSSHVLFLIWCSPIKPLTCLHFCLPLSVSV